MLHITILKPFKSKNRYEFRCIVRGTRFSFKELKHRIKSFLRGYGKLSKTVVRFGYVSLNFDIDHHDTWDTIYPLAFWMNFLVHRGLNIFDMDGDSAQIHFEYPILENAKAFYTKRANDLGFGIEIHGSGYHVYEKMETNGYALAFGGGKDSRLLLGMFREIGRKVNVYTADLNGDRRGIDDIDAINVVRAFSGRAMDRFMPSIMSKPKVFYLGKALGEVMLETPWQQYYEWSAPKPLQETCSFFQSVGIDMRIETPVCILPYNVIQNILYKRYPVLYKYQSSVSKDSPTEKNLHVALCKIVHGISFNDHCSDALFKELLNKFIKSQVNSPDDFGRRRHRSVINLEMRSIIYRMRDHHLFKDVKNMVPNKWDGKWVDCIHTYVYPEVDPNLLQIYREHAKELDYENAEKQGEFIVSA